MFWSKMACLTEWSVGKRITGLSMIQQKSTNAMKMDAIFHGYKRKEKYFDTAIIVSICQTVKHVPSFCKPNAESRGSRCFLFINISGVLVCMGRRLMLCPIHYYFSMHMLMFSSRNTTLEGVW